MKKTVQSEADSIKHLVDGCFQQVEDAPEHQLIGVDGAGWFQQVGHDHDARANKSNLEELRRQIRLKIAAHIDSLGDKPQRGLLKKLELAIIRSDSALMDTARLVGVKPSCGLYTKIKEILVVEENLDPHTDLWRLLGVDP